jgi:hypothetical protein
MEPMQEVVRSALRSEVLHRGILKCVIKEGSGPTVHPNSKIWIQREGRLENGVLFQKPSRYALVIGDQADKIHSSGWSIALHSMRAQEEAWVLIGPECHMFTEPNLVGQSLWFRFYVEHYKITDVPLLDSGVSLDDRLLRAQFFFDEGRRAFHGNILNEAVTSFNSVKQSVLYKKTELAEMSAEEQTAVAEVIQRAQLNCAITHIRQAEQEKDMKRKLDLLNKAGPMLSELLKVRPQHTKAMYHMTKFYLIKSEYREARSLVQSALALNRHDPALVALGAKVDRLINNTGTSEKQMCRKIFKKWEAELEKEKVHRLQAAHQSLNQSFF